MTLTSPRTALRSLTLAVALFATAALAPRAQAITPIPEAITSSPTTVLFYVMGILDAQDEMAAFEKTGTMPAYLTYRERANVQRMLAYLIRDPVGFAYFMGRAEAFTRRADALGEPL